MNEVVEQPVSPIATTQPPEPPVSPLVALFVNPYKGLPDQDKLRVSIDVSRREVSVIKSVTMEWGTMQVALSLFVKYLYTYVNKHQLTITDREQFIIHLLAKCEQFNTAPGVWTGPGAVSNTDVPDRAGPPPSLPPGQRPHGDDGSGVGPIRPGDSSTPNVAAVGKRKSTGKKAKGDNRSGV